MVLHTSQQFQVKNVTNYTNKYSIHRVFKVLQLNANGIHKKTKEMQLLVEITQMVVITIQESKVNQCHKMQHFSRYTYQNRSLSQTRQRLLVLH